MQLSTSVAKVGVSTLFWGRIKLKVYFDETRFSENALAKEVCTDIRKAYSFRSGFGPPSALE